MLYIIYIFILYNASFIKISQNVEGRGLAHLVDHLNLFSWIINIANYFRLIFMMKFVIKKNCIREINYNINLLDIFHILYSQKFNTCYKVNKKISVNWSTN